MPSAVPIMSYNYGAGKPERVKKTFFLILAFSFGFTTIASWLILLFPKTFIMPFTDSQRLIEITIPAIRIYFGGMMFIGVLYACQRTFMALGRTKLSLLGAMMRKLVILLPLCFVLPSSATGRTACFMRNASPTSWVPPLYLRFSFGTSNRCSKPPNGIKSLHRRFGVPRDFLILIRIRRKVQSGRDGRPFRIIGRRGGHVFLLRA